jgi:P4 family phage/plasmid primase-like protien
LNNRPARGPHKTDGSWCWCYKEEAAYRYRGEDGRIVGRKRRIVTDLAAHGRAKTFVWAKGSKQPDLYRLPEVLDEISLGVDGIVWHLTSEKDVELAELELPGTAFCLPNGEKPMGERVASLFSEFCGTYCLILDDDETGWTAAARTVAALSAVGLRCFVFRSGAGKDFSRHLAAGLGLDDLIAVTPEELGARVPESDRERVSGYGLGLVLGALRARPENGERAEGEKIYFRCPLPDGHRSGDRTGSFNAEIGESVPVVLTCSCGPGSARGAEHDRWFAEVLSELGLTAAELWGPKKGGAGSGSYEANDTGNARRLLDAHPADMYWVVTGPAGAGEWRIWNGVHWRIDIDGVVERWAFEVTKAMAAEARGLMKGADPKSEAYKAAREKLKYAIMCGNDARIKAMLNRAKTLDGERTVPIAKFDADPGLIGMKNGVLELRRDGIAFREEKQSDFLTLNTGTPYMAGAERSSREWDRYLDLFLPDLEVREFVMRVLGYSMFGGNPSGLIVFLQGGSNTGKSTINNLLSSTFRGYTSAMNMSALRGSWNSGPREDIADIIRSRFALASESDGEIELHADQIKRFTGDDEISFARKFGHQESMRPWFTPIIATNAPPVVKGADLALHNRLCVLPFDHAVVEKDESGRNMCEDEAARIAFLADVVAGYVRYTEIGLRRDTWPTAVLRAVQDYKEQLSEVSQFIHEMCEFGPEEREEAGALLRSYIAWSDSEKSERQLQTWFGRELARLGHGKIFARGGEGTKPVWHRVGLRLRSNALK